MSTLLWLLGPLLELLIVVRGVRGHFLKRYKFFYFYLVAVLLRDLLLFAVYRNWHAAYPYVYWYSQFLGVLLGCGLVWEIYSLALADYPGAARMARSVLLFLFIITTSRVLVYAANEGRWLPGQTSLETEREFRIVQSFVLAGLIVLVAHYAISMGRNLKGITLGYGFFLGSSLIQLTLREHFGDRFQQSWQYVQPTAYILVLLIWCRALWSYAPAQNLDAATGVAVHYGSLATTTRRQLKEVRTYVAKAVRE